jgi:hypothetical protein
VKIEHEPERQKELEHEAVVRLFISIGIEVQDDLTSRKERAILGSPYHLSD